MIRSRDVAIVSAKRTPIGSFGGMLSSVPATVLGATVLKAVLQEVAVSPDSVDEVIMGQVLTAGVGQAPARQAAVEAGLPEKVTTSTVNKVCGSGLKAVMNGAQSIALGQADVVLAGGMESMSLAPYLLDKARFGLRFGDGQVVDHMIKDGLWDVYNDFHMGKAAELCARHYDLSREDQDAFAIASYRKAEKAIADGSFRDEMIAVEISEKHGLKLVATDEEPSKVNYDKLPTLNPVFDPNGTVTAANASGLNDGAAAVLLMDAEKAEQARLPILGRIQAYTSTAKAPEWFTTAPKDGIAKLLAQMQLSVSDIDLFEINEAFSVVNLAVCSDLDIPAEKLNVHGGAIALGHPIGASGARLLVTLLHALKRYDKKRGIVSLCVGGGESTTMLIER